MSSACELGLLSTRGVPISWSSENLSFWKKEVCNLKFVQRIDLRARLVDQNQWAHSNTRDALSLFFGYYEWQGTLDPKKHYMD
jgi:hypothetical protein